MQKRSSLAKDLITSTHPRFHAMVVSGQPKTKNPNGKSFGQGLAIKKLLCEHQG
jgi:hypothetical protein